MSGKGSGRRTQEVSDAEMQNSLDRIFSIAKSNYEEIEAQRRLDPEGFEERYPTIDPFEGLTAEEMTKILMEDGEDFPHRLAKYGPPFTADQAFVVMATAFPVGEYSEYQPPDFTPVDPFDNWDNYKPGREV